MSTPDEGVDWEFRMDNDPVKTPTRKARLVYVRSLERENRRLRDKVVEWELAGGIIVVVIVLGAIIGLLTGCTFGNETPEERRWQKQQDRMERGSYQFHNGRWEEVK